MSNPLIHKGAKTTKRGLVHPRKFASYALNTHIFFSFFFFFLLINNLINYLLLMYINKYPGAKNLSTDFCNFFYFRCSAQKWAGGLGNYLYLGSPSISFSDSLTYSTNPARVNPSLVYQLFLPKSS